MTPLQAPWPLIGRHSTPNKPKYVRLPACSDKEEDKPALPAAWATALGAAVSDSTGTTAVDEHPSENPTPATPTESAPDSTSEGGKVKSFKGSLKREKVPKTPKDNVPKSTLPTDIPAEQPVVESKTIDVFGNEAWSTCPDLQSSLDWTNYYRSLHG